MRRLAVLALLAGACASTPRSHTDIGMARVGLTLAFSNKALEAAPVPPKVIIVLIPAPPELSAQKSPDLTPYVVEPGRPVPVAPQLPRLCPAAPQNATPSETPPLLIHAPPATGYYRLYNTGTIKVTADGFTFSFPYPPITTMRITNIKTSSSNALLGSTPATSFDEVITVTPTLTVSETYQYTSAELDLVSHHETNKGVTTGDVFTPPIKVYDTKGVGSSWTAVAADPLQHKAMGLSGAINSTHVVDACGSLVDTMEVTSTSTLADLQSGQTSGTTPNKSDVTDLATGLGGIFAARHLQDTQVQTVNGAAVTIVYDVKTNLIGLNSTPTPPK